MKLHTPELLNQAKEKLILNQIDECIEQINQNNKENIRLERKIKELQEELYPPNQGEQNDT